ncbi:DMT family transporter [Thermosynechococcus sp. PP45]|uniref:DMT family transporter n=1 Tax=unclassified Thermosynechococcus TaxID=2622553 RepID=UPI002670D0B1|nr:MULTISPECIES: DMT family transporter [unclassified Thermosynechococcus]WKT81095.1 DMT family transporter [Thermosynechococcus sp. PP45]WNC24706.1 DMT family transporter [Thermosynechococcus sp. PP551]WNC27284.1 DMT family transporter [Thermosynechococcus sp. PP555]
MSVNRPPYWQIALVLGVGVLAVSTAAVLVRWGVADLATDSLGMTVGLSIFLASGRLSLAALFLTPQLYTWPWLDLTRQNLRWALAAGVALAAHFSLWFTSLHYTSVAASTTLVTTTPIWSALVGYLWQRQTLQPRAWVGMAIALGGSALIGTAEPTSAVARNPLLGNALAIAAAWAVSAYFICGQAAQKAGLAIHHYALVAYATAALVLLPLPPLLGLTYGGWPLKLYGAILLLALIPQLVGHTSLNWGVRWLSPTWVTLLVLAEPIAASLFALLLFGEVPTTVVMTGGSLVLVGLSVALWPSP